MSHNGLRNSEYDETRKKHKILNKHKHDHAKCDVKKQNNVQVQEIFERKEGISIASDLGHFRCRIIEIPSQEKDEGFKRVSQEKDVLQIQINKGNLRGKKVPKKVFNVEFLSSTQRSHNNGHQLQLLSKCKNVESEKGFIENIFRRLVKPFEVFKAKPATLSISHKNEVCPLFPKVAMDFSIGSTTAMTPKAEANGTNTVARIYKNVQDIEHHLKEMQVKQCRQWNKIDGEYRNLKQLVKNKTQEVCGASASQPKQRSQAKFKPLSSDYSDISVHPSNLEKSGFITENPTSYRGEQSKPISKESSAISSPLSEIQDEWGTQTQKKSFTSEVTLSCSSTDSNEEEINWQPLSNYKEKKALHKLKQPSDELNLKSQISEDTVCSSSSGSPSQDSKNWLPLSNVKEKKALRKLMRSSEGLGMKPLEHDDKLASLTNDSHQQVHESWQPNEDEFSHSSSSSPPQDDPNWEPLSNLKEKEALQVLINTSTTSGSMTFKNKNRISGKGVQNVSSSELSLPTHVLISRYEAEERRDSEISVHNGQELIDSDKPKTQFKWNGSKLKSAGENDIGISNEIIPTGSEKEDQCCCAMPAKKMRSNYTETSRNTKKNCKKKICPNEYHSNLEPSYPKSGHDKKEIITNCAVLVPSCQSTLHGGNSQSITENEGRPVNKKNKVTDDYTFSNKLNRGHESVLKSNTNSSSGSCLFKNDLQNVFVREQNSNETKNLRHMDQSTPSVKAHGHDPILKSNSNRSISSKNDLENVFIQDKTKGFIFNDGELPSYHSRINVGKRDGNEAKQNISGNSISEANDNSNDKLVKSETSDEQSAYETQTHDEMAMHLQLNNETPFKHSKHPSVGHRHQHTKHNVPKYGDNYKHSANVYSGKHSAKSQTAHHIDPTSSSFSNVKDSLEFVQKSIKRKLNPKMGVNIYDIGKGKMVWYEYDKVSKEFESGLEKERSFYGEHEPFREVHQVEERQKPENEIRKKHKMDKKAMLRKNEMKRYLINYADTDLNEDSIPHNEDLESGIIKEYSVINNHENETKLAPECHNLVQAVLLKTVNRNVNGTEGRSEGHHISDPRKQVVDDSRQHTKSCRSADDKAIRHCTLNKNLLGKDLQERNRKELTITEPVGNEYQIQYQIESANTVKVGHGANKSRKEDYGHRQVLSRKSISIGTSNSDTCVECRQTGFHGHEQVLDCSHVEDNIIRRRALKSNSKDKDLLRRENVNKTLNNKCSEHHVGNARTVKVENYSAKGGKEKYDGKAALDQGKMKKSNGQCHSGKQPKDFVNTNDVIHFSKQTDEKAERCLALKTNSKDKDLENKVNKDLNIVKKTPNNEWSMQQVGNAVAVKLENCTAKYDKENHEKAALHQITMRKSKSIDKCNSGTCNASSNQTKNFNTSNKLINCPKNTDDKTDRCSALKSKSKNKDTEKRVNENFENALKTDINKCSEHRLEHANVIQVQHCTGEAQYDETALHQIKMKKTKSVDRCNSATCMTCKQTKNFDNINEIINFLKHTDDKVDRCALNSNSKNKKLERGVNRDLDNVKNKSSKHHIGNANTIQVQHCIGEVGKPNYDEAALHQITMRKSKSVDRCNSGACMACNQTKICNKTNQEINPSKHIDGKSDRCFAIRTGSKNKDLERRVSEDEDNVNKTAKNNCSKHQLGNANLVKVGHRSTKGNYDQVALRQASTKHSKLKETCNSSACKVCNQTKNLNNTNEVIKRSKHSDDKKNKYMETRVNEDLDDVHKTTQVENCTFKGANAQYDEAALHHITMRKSKSKEKCNYEACTACKQTNNLNSTNEVIDFSKHTNNKANRCLTSKSNLNNKDLVKRVNEDFDNVNKTVKNKSSKQELGNIKSIQVQHCAIKEKFNEVACQVPSRKAKSTGKCNSDTCMARKQAKDLNNANQEIYCSKHTDRSVGLKTDSNDKDFKRRTNKDVNNVNKTAKDNLIEQQAGNANSVKVEHCTTKGTHDNVVLHQITMKDSKSNEKCNLDKCKIKKDFNDTNETLKCSKHAADQADRYLASKTESENQDFERRVNEDLDHAHEIVSTECSKHQVGNANVVKEQCTTKYYKENYDETALHQNEKALTRKSKPMDECDSDTCMACNQTNNLNSRNEVINVSKHTDDRADLALKSNKDLERRVNEDLVTANRSLKNECSKHGLGYAPTIQVQHSTSKVNYGGMAFEAQSVKSIPMGKSSSDTCIGKLTKDFSKTNPQINYSKHTDDKEAGCLASKSKSKNKDLQRLVDHLPVQEKVNEVCCKHQIADNDTVQEHCTGEVGKRNYDEMLTVYQVRRGKSKSTDNCNSGTCIASKQTKEPDSSNQGTICSKNSHGQAMRSLAFQSLSRKKDMQRRVNEDLVRRQETANNMFGKHILGNCATVQVHYYTNNDDKAHYDKATVYKIRRTNSADRSSFDKYKETMKFSDPNEELLCLNKTDVNPIRYLALKSNSKNEDLQREPSEELDYLHEKVNNECNKHRFVNDDTVKHCPCKGNHDEAAAYQTSNRKSKQLEPKCQLKGGTLQSCKEDCNTIEGVRLHARPIMVDEALSNVNKYVNIETKIEYVEELQCAIDLQSGSDIYRGCKGMTDSKRELCNRTELNRNYISVIPKVDLCTAHHNESINYPKGMNDSGSAVGLNSEFVTRSVVENESLKSCRCNGVSIDVETDCERHVCQGVEYLKESESDPCTAARRHHFPSSEPHEKGAKSHPVEARQLYLETTDSKLVLELEKRKEHIWNEAMLQNVQKEISAKEMITPGERLAVLPLLKSKRKYLSFYSFTDFLKPLRRMKKTTMKVNEAKQCKKDNLLNKYSNSYIDVVDDSEESDNSEVHSVITSGIQNVDTM